MPEYVLKCVTCLAEYPHDEVSGTCPKCGDIKGTLDVEYRSLDSIARDSFGVPGGGIFRFLPLLPLSADDPRTVLRVGDTPLYSAPEIANRLGISRLWLKDEGLNPSASLKDRATAIALSLAASRGFDTVAAASTGNAASSLSTLAASMGIRAIIFVPASAPRPKVAQMLLTGAVVLRVRSAYDQAFDLCAEAVRRFGWFSRNTATNPFLAEGKKTCAIEIAEALGWEPPDIVSVGVGDGCVFGAQHKGFRELRDAGLIGSIPRLIGVQASGCAPLAEAFDSHGDLAGTVEPDTYADSIAVGVPRDQVKALRAARQTNGSIMAVTDERIRETVRLLAKTAGIFAEPAGAAGLAGLLELAEAGRLKGIESAVAIVSGHGLKDTEGAMSAVSGSPLDIPPGPEGLREVEGIVGAGFPP